MLNLNAMNVVAVSAATGTAVQQFAAIVKERLCRAVCVNQSIQPTATVRYSLENQTTTGTTTCVELVAQGTIQYVPKGGCGCNTVTQQFVERTMLMFANSAATAAPTISLTQGVSDGVLADKRCNVGKAYQITTDVSVSAVYA